MKSPNSLSSPCRSIVSTVWWSPQESLAFKSASIILMLSSLMPICWTINALGKLLGTTATNVRDLWLMRCMILREATKFSIHMVRNATQGSCWITASLISIMTRTSTPSESCWASRTPSTNRRWTWSDQRLVGERTESRATLRISQLVRWCRGWDLLSIRATLSIWSSISNVTSSKRASMAKVTTKMSLRRIEPRTWTWLT